MQTLKFDKKVHSIIVDGQHVCWLCMIWGSDTPFSMPTHQQRYTASGLIYDVHPLQEDAKNLMKCTQGAIIT